MDLCVINISAVFKPRQSVMQCKTKGKRRGNEEVKKECAIDSPASDIVAG